jgi:hypothetical protein
LVCVLHKGFIQDARIGKYSFVYDEVQSQPVKDYLNAQFYHQGRTSDKILTYNEALKLPGALKAYFARGNPTLPPPSLFSELKSKWGGWFRRRKS